MTSCAESCLSCTKRFVVVFMGSVGLWVGLGPNFHSGMGWVEQIGPMDNSEVRGRLNTKKVCHALLSNLLSSARASYWPSWTVFRHCSSCRAGFRQ